LVDSIQCLTIAIENPAARGEYRVFNQLDEVYSIAELAEMVVKAARKLGIDAKIKNLQNPRIEKEQHYYQVDHERLRKLGFNPIRTIEETLAIMLKDLSKYRDRVLEKSEVITPKTTWHRSLANDLAETSSKGSNIQVQSFPQALGEYGFQEQNIQNKTS
jgi:UDP-sulfoquinovose synthase